MGSVQPVEVADIMIAVISGALVVLMGALYAVLYAFGRLWKQSTLLWFAYGSFALLAISVLTLARALHLDGTWQVVTYTMLVGYFLAPRAIWRLCVGTHWDHESVGPAVPSQAGEN